jgi:alpha-1,2-mannosyltransferase
MTAAVASHAVYQSGRIPFTGFINPFGAVRLLGGTLAAAYAVQAAAIVIAGFLVAYVWRRRFPLPIRAAALASATLAAAPVALFYDLMLASVAIAWLLRADQRYRLAEWDNVALAALFVFSLDPRSMSETLQLPIGPLITLGLAIFVAVHAARTRRMIASHRPIVGFAPPIAVLAPDD